MNLKRVLAIALVLSAGSWSMAQATDYTIASYYFPNYHPDARNAQTRGAGWTEWELVKAARPRFDGHKQPNLPLWGFVDESDPAVMAKKIDAAADHGVDSFIFDWYWYDDGPFLQRGLEAGFMKAENNTRMRFGLMWANHDWIDIHPATTAKKPDLLYPGVIRPETFEKMTDYIIENYFAHPAYWCIDGKPYFSIYELHTFIKSFGSSEGARAALTRFREKTVAAGFPGLHLNAVAFGVRILPNEKAVDKPEALIPYMGFDSVTSYVWIHDVALDEFPQTPYQKVMDKIGDVWKAAAAKYPVPYHPNVTMGWDATPRCKQSDAYENRGYPFMASMSGNTPAAFKEALQRVKRFVGQQDDPNPIITLNCWNEWTEGSYLEPDTVNGMAYLEALKAVFGK